jgi:hypothetical protein
MEMNLEVYDCVNCLKPSVRSCEPGNGISGSIRGGDERHSVLAAVAGFGRTVFVKLLDTSTQRKKEM